MENMVSLAFLISERVPDRAQCFLWPCQAHCSAANHLPNNYQVLVAKNKELCLLLCLSS